LLILIDVLRRGEDLRLPVLLGFTLGIILLVVALGIKLPESGQHRKWAEWFLRLIGVGVLVSTLFGIGGFFKHKEEAPAPAAEQAQPERYQMEDGKR
jgi:hypothetical protein